jgi:hypothetical protein
MLRQANQDLSKRRRAKKIRLRQGGSLTVQDGQDLQDQRDIAQQIAQETKARSGQKVGIEMHARRCSICGKIGHNACTCQNGVEMSGKDNSE